MREAEAILLIRKLNRNMRLDVFRTNTPAAGEDFFVRRTGGPDGQGTNALTIVDMRVRFAIERDLTRHPNRTELQISNLSEQTRAAMETDPLAVDFAAGHAGINKLLVSADVHYAMSEIDGAGWCTKLQLSDSGRVLKHARVNRSYKSGTSVKTLLRDIAKSMGQKLPRNVENDLELNEQLASGDILLGRTPEVMGRILAPYGYEMSMQNGVLQILKDTEARNDVYVVSEETGMIDSPSFGRPKKNGKPPKMEIKMILYPELTPGGLIEVRSKAVTGLFKLMKVRHNGDTEGDQWFTEVDVQPVG